ncbi:hypothetical protein [Brevundimonas sp.]|uniref:hypothetical protein n=1 Tax=Brevundimonas sp. TaxID=1871086 RepID=UPI001AD5FB7A|nr:hypothetical protein [Brevundimonas sp.]MBN9466460.1 hypothetical protein [Brevundimonas sp.]
MISKQVIATLGALALCIGFSDIAVAQQSRAEEIQERNAREGRPAEQPRNPRSRRSQQDAVRQPSAEENLTHAQTALAALGASCTATEAKLLGETPEKTKVYEVVCATGPGYVIQASTPPTGEDCLLLDSASRLTRERDPAAPTGTLCTLPANQNLIAVLADYATRAGVACTVNEGMAIGKGADDSIFYEVGCDGTDGYRLSRKGDVVTKTSCLQLASAGYTCRFSTKAEQVADLQKLLAGTDAAACAPTDLRYMGGNANGEFIEAKCATEGQGYIARVKEGLVQQVYPCATAQQIGGGCKLTPAPAAAPAPASGGRL